MNQLERAISIALQAHEDVRDKAGQPYILHPLRLMLQMTTEDEMITAVLHDVIEDSDIVLGTLAGYGFAPNILHALTLLTHADDSVPYLDYVAAIATNPLARAVKMADLQHNMDVRRLPPNLTPKDFERLAKYRRAWEVLSEADAL